jgi:hypothetical protein
MNRGARLECRLPNARRQVKPVESAELAAVIEGLVRRPDKGDNICL